MGKFRTLLFVLNLFLISTVGTCLKRSWFVSFDFLILKLTFNSVSQTENVYDFLFFLLEL